jgi:hypothetical protein
MSTKNTFWFLSISILLIGMFSVRDLDSRYGRSINGDGKAYYAYLPALFIYQDPNYTFIDEVESKYYPTDRSQFKDFLNKQKNGKYVNKTFPGLSILYAPFFFVSMLVAWLGGFAVDGYSAPFQWGIAFSHIVYFFIGLRFLLAFFRRLKLSDAVSYLVFTLLLFGTNTWYYLVYDHSVSHIHNFFLSSVFLFTLLGWIQTKRFEYLGWSGVVLSLLVITRPTNMVMVLFIPLLADLSSVPVKDLLSKAYWNFKRLLSFILIGIVILSIPFLLWKWQSDLWLVYSYNEEGFDFKHPRLFDFLFSYQKGWLLWSPVLFFGLVASIWYFAKRSLYSLICFILPLSLITYILASWWCWTYGTGFGQRPLIEYLPFIGLGIALFLSQLKRVKWVYFVIVPFGLLSLFQGYQIANSILHGGETTKEAYWSHFLQWKQDAPTVELKATDVLIQRSKREQDFHLSKKHPYSFGVQTEKLDDVRKLIVKVVIGGKHADQNVRIVLSNKAGDFYKDFYIGDFIYAEPREMEFSVEPPKGKGQQFVCYCWNGDSDSKAHIRSIELIAYK